MSAHIEHRETKTAEGGLKGSAKERAAGTMEKEKASKKPWNELFVALIGVLAVILCEFVSYGVAEPEDHRRLIELSQMQATDNRELTKEEAAERSEIVRRLEHRLLGVHFHLWLSAFVLYASSSRGRAKRAGGARPEADVVLLVLVVVLALMLALQAATRLLPAWESWLMWGVPDLLGLVALFIAIGFFEGDDARRAAVPDQPHA